MPLRISHLLPQHYRQMPWRNGRGSTTEIAIEPAGSALGSTAPFLWRLSMAPVEADGPFSSFPGYDRTLVLLSGSGVHLDFGAAAPPVTLAAPLAYTSFAGDWPTSCQLLDGPVRDFNVMVDRTRATALVRTVALAAHSTTALHLGSHTTLLYVPEGSVILHLDPPSLTHTVTAGQTLRLDVDPPGGRAAAQLCADTSSAQLILVTLAVLG